MKTKKLTKQKLNEDYTAGVPLEVIPKLAGRKSSAEMKKMTLTGQQVGQQNVETLRRYLEANAGKLPSFNGKLNKSRIAKETGLDRQVVEDNTGAAPLLAPSR